MQVKDKRIFEKTTLNTDKEQGSMLPNEYRYIENCTDLVYNGATQTAITNIQSNKLITVVLPEGDNFVIGSYNWKQESSVIYFLYNSLGSHCVLKFSRKTLIIEYIFHDELLNFSKTYPVNSISVIDGMLNWTDNYNEPRSILIDKAIKYTSSIKYNLSYIFGSFINNINWTTYFVSDTTGLSIGDIIYVKGYLDEFYNGLCSILSVDHNTHHVIVNKYFSTTPTGNGYALIYEGNKKYYDITEDLLRFIKKPPVQAPKTSYNSIYVTPNKHQLVLTELTIGSAVIQLDFGIGISGGSMQHTKFSLSPYAGEYPITDDKKKIISTIANVLENSIYKSVDGYFVVTDENKIEITRPTDTLASMEFSLSMTTTNTSEYAFCNVSLNDVNTTIYNTSIHASLVQPPLPTIPKTKDNPLKGRYFGVCYRWKYDDKSYSVFSTLSKINIPVGDIDSLGALTENTYFNNVLNIETQNGSDEVEQIEIAIVTNENPNAPYVIKRIYKYDDIGNHNLLNFTEKYKTNVSNIFDFTNTEFGINISDTEVQRLFDLVPNKSKELTILDTRNAVFANYTEGYDNVSIVGKLEAKHELLSDYQSGIVSVTTINGIVIHLETYQITYSDAPFIAGSTFYFTLYLQGNSASIIPSITKIIKYTTYEGQNKYGVIAEIANILKSEITNAESLGLYGISQSTVLPIYSRIDISYYSYSDIVISITNANIVSPFLETTFKSGATHRLGVRYYDRSGRCGADNELGKIYVPIRCEWDKTPATYDFYFTKNRINVKLYSLPPSWADKYEIVYAQSNIQNFVQFYGDITYSATNNSYSCAIQTKIKDLHTNFPKTLGNLTNYSYTKGDRMRILGFTVTTPITYNGVSYTSTDQFMLLPEVFDVVVTGEKAGIEIYFDNVPPSFPQAPADITKIGAIKIEIYTPKKERPDTETGEVYYSIGECNLIENGFHKGTVDQTLTSPAEILLEGGDVFTRRRLTDNSNSTTNLAVESSTINDYFVSDNIWYSKPSLVLQDAKSKLFKTHYRWGGNFIEGSDTSYLKRFLSADFDALPETFGGITKTIQRGQTLKFIQENKVYSTYIGATEFNDASGNASLIKSETLFGSKRQSDFDFGSKYPKSVVKTPNAIYFVDIENSSVIADAGNALQDITVSRVKAFMNFIKKMFYASYSNEIHSVYEQSTESVLFTFTWTDEIFIGKDATPTYKIRSKTLVWSESYLQFKGFFDNSKTLVHTKHDLYTPNDITPIDNACEVSNEYVTFMNGNLWLHADTSTRNHLYGEQKPMIVQVPSNIGRGKIMVYDSIEISTTNNKYNETNPEKNWSAIVETASDGISPNGQLSEVKSGMFKQKEGLLCSDILRDKNTLMAGSDNYKLFNGDVMRADSCLITLENESDEEVVMLSVMIKQSASEMSS